MLNQTAIMGRLTKDPELRHTGSGTAVCSFTVAVERDGKTGEDGKRQADFIDCVAWRGTAEFLCRYFKKGQMIVAAGRMQTRTWRDRNDQSRKATELNAETLYFGGAKKLEQAADIYTGEEREYGEYEEAYDEDIPF